MEQLPIILISLGQAILIMLLAPLVAGTIKTVKANLQNRRGSSVFQVYYDLTKLLAKSSVVSPTTSWIFMLAPYLYFAGAFGAAALTPLAAVALTISVPFADLFVLIYLFAVGRFFLALASLDAGSAFGGMGGSRELFISILVEPALLLAMITVAAQSGSTNLGVMAGTTTGEPFSLPYIFAAISFLIVLVAETGRIPVDNPDTHLELTMIHEGMVLEYSGRWLGLIFWASAMKQLIFILLFTVLFLPWQPLGQSLPVIIVWTAGKVLVVAAALAALETSTNKMRLFKVPGFLGVAGLLALLALVAQ